MKQLLTMANTTLALFLVALVVTILIAYPLAAKVPMFGQVAAHIGTLLFATGIKVAYIVRLVSLRALGRPLH